MLRVRSCRLTLAALVLACWATPAAQAVSVGLHVALSSGHTWNGSHAVPDDQGHDHHEHADRSVESHAKSDAGTVPEATLAAHHRHALTPPDPGPPGVRQDAPAGPGHGLAACPSWDVGESALAPDRLGPADVDVRRRGSPAALFYAHCSLLR